MNLQDLYEMAPCWLQNIAVNIQGELIKKRRYNRHFFEELKQFEAGAYDQEEELQAFLLSIVDVPAYKKVFTSQLIDEIKDNKENVYSVLASFPIIMKADIKEHINDYINKDYSGKTFTMRTSGTTGSGLAFPYPIDFENKQWAIWWQFRRKWGIQLDTWCGWFGGKRMMNPNCKKPPYWRINKAGHQVMYSSYHLTKDTVKLFYDDIHKRGLSWLHGYPSHLAKLSALILESGLRPIDKVKWVTTGAEGLVGNQSVLIQKAFPNAHIGQHYGQMEGVAIMNKFDDGAWETVDEFAYVEFIPVNTENPNICRIVGTGFCNKAFPLVRYDTGDLVEVKWNIVDGRKVPEILRIDGRTSNTIKQPSGHEITEAALSIVLHDFDNIAEAQFHQIAIDDVVLWVVKGKKYSDEDERDLLASLAKTLDNDMKISLKYVDSVERTIAGKLRLVIPEFTSVS